MEQEAGVRDVRMSADSAQPIRVGMDRDNTPIGKVPEYSTKSQDTNVELTILVAMPQPPYQPDHLRPPAVHSSGSSSSLTSIDLKNPHIDPDPFTFSDLPHYQSASIVIPSESEEEELPYVEIGTTVVPLSIISGDDREAVQELRLGTMGSRAGIAGDWGRSDTVGSGR